MKFSRWLFVFLLAISIINYPNPFNPKGGEIVTFECVSPSTLEAALYLYDLSARLIWQSPFSLAGGATNRISWNGLSSFNSLVANGIYLYRLIDPKVKTSLGRGKVWVINR